MDYVLNSALSNEKIQSMIEEEKKSLGMKKPVSSVLCMDRSVPSQFSIRDDFYFEKLRDAPRWEKLAQSWEKTRSSGTDAWIQKNLWPQGPDVVSPVYDGFMNEIYQARKDGNLDDNTWDDAGSISLYWKKAYPLRKTVGKASATQKPPKPNIDRQTWKELTHKQIQEIRENLKTCGLK
jgi:hypothetical protein